MSEVMEYKCPYCGGAMEFDSKSQKMKCPYCDSEMTIEAFNNIQKEETQETENPAVEASEDGQWREGETENMRIYACQSCGGEIVADVNTGATSCPFCGNPVVMKGQFAGDLRPDYIIPFKKDKKAAKAAYYEHLKGKAFLPGIFKKENHIDEIKGVYVPFWLFDADAQADIHYEAEKIRVWEKGDTEYTEHRYYDVHRAGSVSFQNIPEDGSTKMDDALMESIEPFNFDEAVPFETAYLAGYLADRYDVTKEDRLARAEERMTKSAEISMKQNVDGYDVVRTSSSHVNMRNTSHKYALYPVWILNTTWKGESYIFAMNGQTGKMVGNLPFDKNQFYKYIGTRSVIIGVILYALMSIITLL